MANLPRPIGQFDGKYRTLAATILLTVLTVAGLATLVPLGGCGSSPTPPPASAQCAVATGRLQLYGRLLTTAWTPSDLFDILGPPSRQQTYVAQAKAPPVTVHVWDDRGIFAYEQPERKRITQLTLVLAPRETTLNASDRDSFWPTGIYTGGLVVEGCTWSAQSDPQQLNLELGDSPLTRLAKFPFTWTMTSRSLSITAVTPANSAGLLEVSIGR